MVFQALDKSGDEQKLDVIRLLIADDHELVLDIARMNLDQQSDMDVTMTMSIEIDMSRYKNRKERRRK